MLIHKYLYILLCIFCGIFLSSQPVLSDNFVLLNLSNYFNNDVIARDGDRNVLNFDTSSDYSTALFNYTGQELLASNTIYYYEIPFYFPDKSEEMKNNIICDGQIIAVPENAYSTIYILGASILGNYSELLLINYQDGSVDTTILALSDWTGEPQFGELTAIHADFQYMKPDGYIATAVENHIWLQKISAEPNKIISSIQLPVSPFMHIFAITLGKGDEIDFTEFEPIIPLLPAPDKLNIKFQYYQPGNIYYIGETARLRAIVQNIPDDIERFQLTIQLTDIAQNIIMTKNELLTRWENRGFIYNIQYNSRTASWYQLEFGLKDNNNIFYAATTYLAFIPISPSVIANENFIFGMELNFAGLTDTNKQYIGLLAQRAGIQWLRKKFPWKDIEPEEDKWNWHEHDKSVALAQNYNFNILALICHCAGWNEPNTEVGYNQYIQFVQQLVQRYKDKIKYWEICNAPNTLYEQKTPEQYLELLKIAYSAIKETDSNAQIIGSFRMGVDFDFIQKIFNAGGFDYLDVISVQPYHTPYPDETNLLNDLLKLQQLIDEYNGEKEIWITELGWSTTLSQQNSSLNYLEQAIALLRSRIILQSSGLVDKLFWYRFNDMENYPEYNFGIIRPDLSPKPAYPALANMNRILQGYQYVSTLQFGDNIPAFLFENNNQKLIVTWNKAGSTTITIKSNSQTLTVTDLFGHSITILPVDNLFTIILNESPIYITGKFTELSKISGLFNLYIPTPRIRQREKMEFALGLQDIFSRDIIGNLWIQSLDLIKNKLIFEEQYDLPNQHQPVELKLTQAQELQFQFHLSDNAAIGLTPWEIRLDTKDGGSFRLQTQFKIQPKQ